MMKGIIYYVWQHRLLNRRGLYTADGKKTEIIDYGSWDEECYMVKNAKVRIGDEMFSGNVLLVCNNKETKGVNMKEENIILKIMLNGDDDEIYKLDSINRLQLKCDDSLIEEYDAMEKRERRLQCYEVMAELEDVVLHSIMSRLLMERIEEKAANIEKIFKASDSKWDDTLFRTIIRSFGFGIQSDIFEEWGNILDMRALAKHRDRAIQVEAIMFGQAGLLNEESIPYYYYENAICSTYFKELQREYRFLSRKFGLKEMSYKEWGMSNNTPHLRIARLAALYFGQKASISSIAACDTTAELNKLLDTPLQGYWYNHTCFGGTETSGNGAMRARHCDIIIINAIVPILFIYGKRHNDLALCNKAEDFLHFLKSEENSIVRRWKEQGIEIDCAADSQAFLQLNRRYCSVCNCEECHFAYHYIKRRITEEN